MSVLQQDMPSSPLHCCADKAARELQGVHWLVVQGQEPGSFSCLARAWQSASAGAQATHSACWKQARTTRGVNIGAPMASSLPRKEDLYFWELLSLHCPPEALSGLAFLPCSSCLLSHTRRCCLGRDVTSVFGPKGSSAIHKLNHKMLQHHSHTDRRQTDTVTLIP